MRNRGGFVVVLLALVTSALVASAVAGVGAIGVTEQVARAGEAAPVVQELRAPQRVHRYKMFESRASVVAEFENPFDPAQIDVQGVFVAPNGTEYRSFGFWFQNYERSLVGGFERRAAVGAPHWRIRFSPPTVGAWTWWWEVSTPLGTTATAPRPLTVVAGDADGGVVRVSAEDDRYLARDGGEPYFAVGENTSWYDGRGTYAYDDWFAKLEAQGATFGRVWMARWAFSFEELGQPLGDYRDRLDRAWQLDYVLADAERRGIAIELALQYHGAFSTVFNPNWDENPYNIANGGFLEDPTDFFTEARALRLTRQKYRYIVARWGYSRAVLAWELWNEVDLVGADPAVVAVWHREMADYLRSIDPLRHLVSTSHSFFLNGWEIWDDASLDFTQIHEYALPLGVFPDIADSVVAWTRDRQRRTGGPVLFSELGVDSRGPNETRVSDPEGIGIHDGLWGGVVSGGFGTAMTWWWDNLIDPDGDRYYPMFGSVARFIDGVRWPRESFAYSDATVTSVPTRDLRVHGLTGRRAALFWVKDHAYQWSTPAPVPINGARLRVDPLGGKARWCGRIYNTWTGTWVGTFEVRGNRALDLALPSFVGDLAVGIDVCPS